MNHYPNIAQTVAQESDNIIAARIRGSALTLHVPPFVCRIRSPLENVAAGISRMYRGYCMDQTDYADFHIEINRAQGIRSVVKPLCVFDLDGNRPFFPLPAAHGFALFEWGFNWAIGNHAHTYMILHAGVLAKGNAAIILPGEPGAGKSTLCAALMIHGYRLLSDELTLLGGDGVEVHPCVRPVSLKNQSLDVIRTLAPDACMTQPAYDTAKGTVGHLRASEFSIANAATTAHARFVVFPRYKPGAELNVTAVPEHEAMLRLADSAFNYHLLGVQGYRRLSNLVDNTRWYSLEYSRLDDALAWFDGIVMS